MLRRGINYWLSFILSIQKKLARDSDFRNGLVSNKYGDHTNIITETCLENKLEDLTVQQV